MNLKSHGHKKEKEKWLVRWEHDFVLWGKETEVPGEKTPMARTMNWCHIQCPETKSELRASLKNGDKCFNDYTTKCPDRRMKLGCQVRTLHKFLNWFINNELKFPGYASHFSVAGKRLSADPYILKVSSNLNTPHLNGFKLSDLIPTQIHMSIPCQYSCKMAGTTVL